VQYYIDVNTLIIFFCRIYSGKRSLSVMAVKVFELCVDTRWCSSVGIISRSIDQTFLRSTTSLMASWKLPKWVIIPLVTQKIEM